MQAAGVRRGPAVWCCRRLLEKSGIGWNRPSLRPVVEGVRKLRAAAAVLVASCVVVSGCTSSGEEEATTASEPVVETPSNPWDLPLEQRPPLFDPCEEIPIEAVEEALGGSVWLADELRNYEPNNLHSCGWQNDEVLFGVLASWRDKEGFRDDPEFVNQEWDTEHLGRSGLRATIRGDQTNGTCYHVFFTARGSVFANVNMTTSLNQFRGERLVSACEVIEQSIGALHSYLPEGDF